MNFHRTAQRIMGLLIIFSLLLSGCGEETDTPPVGLDISTGTASSSTPTGTTAAPTGPVTTAVPPTVYPPPQTPLVTSYPGAATPFPVGTDEPYPGAVTTLLSPPTATARNLTPSPALTGTMTGSQTLTVTLTISGTATERPITTAEAPPQPPLITVSIWHSWDPTEQQVLDYVLRAFQSVYPNVAFHVTYVPAEQLQSRYQAEAYYNRGPSVLLAPAEWGPGYYDQGLVLDISPIAEPNFLATINQAALEQSRYQGALIGLPHSIREGVVMYRNRQIIPNAPLSFDEMVQLAQAATGGGKAGAYLDRSFEFSGANLPGIGGTWQDESGNPAFNNPLGLEWLSLLDAYEMTGVAGFNTDRDVQLFKAGRIGIIFESTLRQEELAEAIGPENLSIDPWPLYGGGSLSGFIYTDSIYINPRTGGDERYNALLLMGFLLAPEVQAMLTTAGHTPAVTDLIVEDSFMQQEMEAFLRATAYPIDPQFSDFPAPIQAALRAIFEQNSDPSTALNQAELEIRASMGD